MEYSTTGHEEIEFCIEDLADQRRFGRIEGAALATLAFIGGIVFASAFHVR
jgi:hypothetical protein